MINNLKTRWANQETLTNAWITIPDSWTAELVASVGFDVMTIDAQHGLATDLSTILPMLQAIKTGQSVPFVRVPPNDQAFIMRMLDAGVQGIICPMIDDATETEAFVKATKYYPKGIRSYGPLRANAIFGEDYLQKSNDAVVTLAMIETPAALKNIREIAKVPDLDGFYVGPWDLSLSLGYKNLADFNDVSFLAILKEIVAVATENKLNVGIHAGSPENAKKMADMGFKFVTTFNDSAGLKTAAKNALASYKNLSGSNSKEAY
jgi:4-hydroxy-2-oxoheptanedioate aldolase